MEQLARFFHDLAENGDGCFFHPHPLTDEEARHRIAYTGKDLYFAQLDGGTMTGYGMLRGWDAGYRIPSLGIAIHPEYRRHGLALRLMRYLHQQARAQGAAEIRLTVEQGNSAARRLYAELGYRFDDVKENGRQVGRLKLTGKSAA